MSFSNSISPAQLQIAQTLWSQHAQRSLDVIEDQRQARLAFAYEVIGRKIESFRDLTRYEAHLLINALKKSLGLPITVRNRALAEDRGLQGRDASQRHAVIASKEDLERIESALARLGWNEEQYRKWLESRRSPLKGKQSVRTQADANRVWWALKRMLVRAGAWQPAAKAAS